MATMHFSFDLSQSSTSSSGTEPVHSAQCSTSLKRYDDLSPEQRKIVCLRSGCPQIKFACSSHEEMFIKLYELNHKSVVTPQKTFATTKY
jgi:hypothetical protein